VGVLFVNAVFISLRSWNAQNSDEMSHTLNALLLFSSVMQVYDLYLKREVILSEQGHWYYKGNQHEMVTADPVKATHSTTVIELC
jgi:hypothetical protein